MGIHCNRNLNNLLDENWLDFLSRQSKAVVQFYKDAVTPVPNESVQSA